MNIFRYLRYIFGGILIGVIIQAIELNFFAGDNKLFLLIAMIIAILVISVVIIVDDSTHQQEISTENE